MFYFLSDLSYVNELKKVPYFLKQKIEKTARFLCFSYFSQKKIVLKNKKKDVWFLFLKIIVKNSF